MVTCQSANQLRTLFNGFLSLQNGLSVWFTRLHNHGEDLIWQLSRRQSLTPFTRRVRHKHSLPKKLSVHRVLYPSMLTEVEWKEKVWKEKMHNQPREPQPYEDCQAKSIQEFGWTSQGMDWGWGQGIKSTTHRRVEEFGYSCRQRRLTWDKRRRTGLLPSGPKSSFQMRASFVLHLETKVLESGGRVEKLIAQVAWSPVLSFHSLWWFGVQCHLLV